MRARVGAPHGWGGAAVAAGGRARFGAPGANSLQQAALKLLLPEMSWAGRMLVLTCARIAAYARDEQEMAPPTPNLRCRRLAD